MRHVLLGAATTLACLWLGFLLVALTVDAWVAMGWLGLAFSAFIWVTCAAVIAMAWE